jgi:enamine deaminase RidA (YjgF/YER057c/UK114 family)
MQGETRFRIHNPDGLHKPMGYSHLAEVSGGKLVYISGQVALDKSGNVVGKDDFRAQVRQVFENLKTAVGAAGGDFNHVIKLNIYVLDVSRLSDLREVRDEFVNTHNPPASTLVQAVKLARPEFLVEVEAIAVI